MAFFTILQQCVANSANASTTGMGVASSGGWISKHTTGHTVHRCRDCLHYAMNVLDAVIKDGAPVPEHIVRALRKEHAALTAQVDKIEELNRKLVLFSKNGVTTVFQLILDAHTADTAAQELRCRIQRTSDLARNMRMGNGTLESYHTTSTWSLVSSGSSTATNETVDSQMVSGPEEQLESAQASEGRSSQSQWEAILEIALEPNVWQNDLPRYLSD